MCALSSILSGAAAVPERSEADAAQSKERFPSDLAFENRFFDFGRPKSSLPPLRKLGGWQRFGEMGPIRFYMRLPY